MKNTHLLLLAFVFALASCKPDADPVVELQPSTVDPLAWRLDNMDPNYRPGDEFFMYCNGKWFNNTELGSKPIVGLLRDDADKFHTERMAGIDDPQINKYWQEVQQMDQTTTKATEALVEAMKILDGVKTKEEAWAAMANILKLGYCSFLNMNTVSLSGRMYATFRILLSSHQNISKEWYAHCLKHAGMNENEAEKSASSAVKVIKQLSLIEPRDLSLESLLKHPKWQEELVAKSQTRTSGTEIPMLDKISGTLGIDVKNVLLNQSMESFYKSLQTVGVDELVAVLKAKMAEDLLYTSSKAIQDYNIKNNKSLTVQQLADSTRNQYMGYLYSRAFATKYITAERKVKFKTICEEMRSAFLERLESIDWMSQSTKARAREKMVGMKFNVGYPDQWIEEGFAQLTKGTLVENVFLLRQALFNLNKSFLGKNSQEVSFSEFILIPHNDLTIVNASYYAARNTINIRPAFMLEPFYDETLSDAYNYGLFVVIGHEIVHGFDSHGSNYNTVGDLQNWWTVADKMEFKERQNRLIQCYNLMEVYPEVLPGEYGNGEFTLSENIADIGGLDLVLTAFSKKLERDGYHGDEMVKQKKRFFQAYAELFREKATAQAILKRIKDDEHSFGRQRVNGAVMNCDRWYELFDVKWGDNLYLKPEKRAQMW